MIDDLAVCAAEASGAGTPVADGPVDAGTPVQTLVGVAPGHPPVTELAGETSRAETGVTIGSSLMMTKNENDCEYIVIIILISLLV